MEFVQREIDAIALRNTMPPRSWSAPAALLILLDLYRARHIGQTAFIKQVSLASLAPPTTALRAVSILVSEGWIVRVPSKRDRRVVFLQLTLTADELMERWATEFGELVHGRRKAFKSPRPLDPFRRLLRSYA